MITGFQSKIVNFLLPALAVLLFSCVNDMEMVQRFIDTETEPDMTGEQVEVMYSDSARLQMKMITPLIKQFNSVKEQRDEYPEGLHAWFYENTGELKAEIRANWAKYDKIAELWEARSDVVLINDKGEKLETEQLFWDTQKAIVYSEKYTKITSPDGSILTGTTFTARQDFTEWRLSSGRATIIINDNDNENDEDKED